MTEKVRSERPEAPDIVIITGMSGSGRTQALHVFEDMGYFCIDNLPPRLILPLAELVGIGTTAGKHLAVVSDRRSQDLFEEMDDALFQLEESGLGVKVVFLDATDEILVRRYDENRRKHPLALEGERLEDAIKRERELLQDIRRRSDLVIDTSKIRTQTLRSRLRTAFSELSDEQQLEVNVFSFGFKHGMPSRADLMIDVRFLPNPFYDPEMRNLTGLDEKVADYVFSNPATQQFMDAWRRLLDVVMPGYVAEGKAELSIAVGCTGGQHRSVAIANATAAYLTEKGYKVNVSHPDIAYVKKDA